MYVGTIREYYNLLLYQSRKRKQYFSGRHLREIEYRRLVSLCHLFLGLGLLCAQATLASTSASFWAESSWWHSIHHWPPTSGDTPWQRRQPTAVAPRRSTARKCLFSSKFKLELNDSEKNSVPLFLPFSLPSFLSCPQCPFFSASPFCFNWSSRSAGSALFHLSLSFFLFPFLYHLLAMLVWGYERSTNHRATRWPNLHSDCQ